VPAEADAGLWQSLRMPLMHRALIGCVVVSLACGDDGSAANESTSSSDSSSESTSSPTTTLTTSSTDTGTTAPSSSTAQPDSSSGELPAPEVTVELTTYDAQPMVADLVLVTSVPATATLVHATDPGVVITQEPSDDDTHLRFRLRGLAPEAPHILDYEVTSTEGGGTTSGTYEFESLPPLLGFVPTFGLETTDVDPAPLYRLADYNVFPFGDFAGALMVDTQGTTRWYMSAPTTLQGPPSVWVGVKLRADGSIVYLQGDTFYIRDELGTIVSEIPAVDLGLGVLHHDVHELPNGNFMALSMDFQMVEYADSGMRLVCGDVIVEFTPDGEVVWTWNAFDHLDPQRRRANHEDPIVDPLTGAIGDDWTHANGFIFDERAGTITVSLRHQDWIIQIDYESGNILWRLGDDGSFELADGDRWFFHQHSPQWQPDGSLLLYDNGNGNPEIPDLEVHSRAMRMELDMDAMTTRIAWQDDEPPYATVFAGDADVIDGGHILVTDSSIFGPNGMNTRLRELQVGNDPERIWTMYTPPGRWIYRTTAHPRLVGQALE
jgi:hypothetical protein